MSSPFLADSGREQECGEKGQWVEFTPLGPVQSLHPRPRGVQRTVDTLSGSE